MRYLRTDGKEIKSYKWKCGTCQNDVIPNLCQIEGGPPFPFDIPINCANCSSLVAIFNPTPPPIEEPPPADEPDEPAADGGSAKDAKRTTVDRRIDVLTDQDGRLHDDYPPPGQQTKAADVIDVDEPEPEPEPKPEPKKKDLLESDPWP